MVCGRPAPLPALTCAYCGEDLPQRRQLQRQRAGIAAAALLGTATLVVARGWSPIPDQLTLSGAALVALGTGLALLPPALRGVAGFTRRDRLWQAGPRYFGGLALALLTAALLLAASTPKPWTLTDPLLAAAAALALLLAPPAFNLPWHKLAAGLLLAAGERLTTALH